MDIEELERFKKSPEYKKWEEMSMRGVKTIMLAGYGIAFGLLVQIWGFDNGHNVSLKSYSLDIALKRVAQKQQIELIPQYNKEKEIVMRFRDGGTGALRIHDGEMVISNLNGLNPEKTKIDTDKLLYSLKDNLIIPEGKIWDYTITRNPDDSIKVRL